MAVHGYITHAAHNRRCTAWLVLGYVVAFEVIGAFALTMGLLAYDHEHTILSNPAGYALRYAVPIAALAGLMFWRMYSGHAKAVTQSLGVQIVTRRDEPRFVQVAEEQCTALGVRLPRFGIIEAGEPNAVTVGEGPTRGLIAVTRGLLDRLDDDELAAVLAHEASHIRHGDTRLAAANHALMRTAVILQMNNPLRLENWRQMIVPLLVPPMLLLMLAGSALMALSMQLSRAARRALKLSRDHVADGEAIRVTHFPEALISAIAKVGGRGAFEGSYRVEDMLFDGPADHEGGSHPAATDRIDAIGTLGRELMNPARLRRDSRIPARPAFGRRPRMAATAYPLDASGRPLEQPIPPARYPLLLYFTDRETFRQWHNACVAWTEWQLRERRNLLGLTSKMMIPVAVTFAAIVFIYWPKDGNLSRLMSTFNPAEMVEIARMTHSGPFCIGPSYPDGKCPGAKNAPVAPADAPATGVPATVAPAAQAIAPAERKAPAAGTFTSRTREAGNSPPPQDDPQSSVVRVLLIAFVIMVVVRPGLLRKLFGVVGTLKTDPGTSRSADVEHEQEFAPRPPPIWNVTEPVRSAPPSGPVVFGRRK